MKFWEIDSSHHTTLRGSAILLLILGLVLILTLIMPPLKVAVPYYLPLHTFAETTSIIISMMVFTIGWSSRGTTISNKLVVVSCLFFGVACLDFSHTASYIGMPDFFGENDANKHLNFWLGARFLAAIALFIFVLPDWKKPVSNLNKYSLIIMIAIIVVIMNWAAIHHSTLLPSWFIKNQGLTLPKILLEFGFLLINLVTALILWRKMRQSLDFKAGLVFAALCVMAMSEIFFMLYVTMSGVYNLLGHLYKVIGYILIYRAVVVESIDRPYRDVLEVKNQLKLAVQASNTGIWDWNINSDNIFFSDVFANLMGYTNHEMNCNASSWEAMLHSDDLPNALQKLHKILISTSEKFYEDEFRMRHRDGSYRLILSRGEVYRDANGRAVRIVGTLTDFTEHNRQEQRFRSAVEASPNAMIMVDETGLIILTNSQVDKLFGYEPNALIGKNVVVLIPESKQGTHAKHIAQHFKLPIDGEIGVGRKLYALHRNGHEFRVEIRLTTIVNQEGNYTIASVVDITERLEYETRINQLINFDPLTGLPNRQMLSERVRHEIQAAYRGNKHLAVMFMDLDNFKNVNDTLGHLFGDLLLMEVGQRLQSVLRATDMVARVGGDEFIILLPDSGEGAAARVASKILKLMSKSCFIQEHDLTITPSIGIAVFPENGGDFEILSQRADNAMYRAKEEGRNCFRFFNIGMQDRAARMLKVENALRHALARNELHLQFQPQLSIDEKRLVGVEALLRWTSPELGMVSPAEFIPIAETTGQIVAIGAWVLETAVLQAKAWSDVGLPPMVISVNLSVVQFRDPDLYSRLQKLLQNSRLSPELLELEITESSAMINPDEAIATLIRLSTLGLRTSIDDFGTGYSSLSYLKKLKIHKLKIDQSFIHDLTKDTDDLVIVETIIQMAHNLGLITIAEGVETSEQLDLLREKGCDQIQGYLLSKPLDADAFEEFVRQRM